MYDNATVIYDDFLVLFEILWADSAVVQKNYYQPTIKVIMYII